MEEPEYQCQVWLAGDYGYGGDEETGPTPMGSTKALPGGAGNSGAKNFAAHEKELAHQCLEL